jgi:hypothetical protein
MHALFGETGGDGYDYMASMDYTSYAMAMLYMRDMVHGYDVDTIDTTLTLEAMLQGCYV